MTLAYTKIQPEEAVTLLENLVVEGYQLKDKLELEYTEVMKSGDPISDTNIGKWDERLRDWSNLTLNKLAIVFLTPRQQYNFRDAPTSPMRHMGINSQYENIIKHLQARIDVLNGYIDFLFQHSKIQIISGRDTNVQIGQENNLVTKN